MTELELTVSPNTWNRVEGLQAVLDQFEARHHIRVRVTVLPWDTAWSDLMKTALYKHGADVSQIGSSWMSDFIRMHALEPFDSRDVAEMGGAAAFFPSIWQSCSLGGGPEVWAMPWWTDTRVIYYRRDLLERAGIDEQTAFGSAEALDATLRRLQQSGVDSPWTVLTQHAPILVHTIASWIWGAGGDLVSADGKRIRFGEEEALSGIRAYFALHRYLPPHAHGLSGGETSARYHQGEAAAFISGSWERLHYPTQAPIVRENTRVARVPGVPFVGGCNLVIWNHTRHKRAALELVRFLTSLEGQIDYTSRTPLFPARLEAWPAARFADDVEYRVMQDALRIGRGFPSVSMWGLIEDGLLNAFSWLWEDIATHPNIDVDAAAREHIEPLVRRLNLTLNG
ncbi:MAG TPA: extracellular solute-binding protein [Anaerolineae bacterium]|nr:extracellular solute-binding protein [Anaerolineae bacterium]